MPRAWVNAFFVVSMLYASQAVAAGPNNGNQWLVTTNDDKDFLLAAHEMTVTAGGSLVFTVIWGTQPLVTAVVSAGHYKCVRAVTLTADDPTSPTTSMREAPPYVPGCAEFK